MNEPQSTIAWPRVLGVPPAGQFKLTPDSFIVVEQMAFEPEGTGDHLWCWIEKRGIDTHRAIMTFARVTGTRDRDIGYSGLKDRQAITRQWLSLPVQALVDGKFSDEQIAMLSAAGISILKSARHPRKLKRGSHRANHFDIAITFSSHDLDSIQERWNTLLELGVPNYFGAQRFGYQGGNISRAKALLARGWKKKEDRQGLLLSTARSYIFNRILGTRISQGIWNIALDGEILNLDGSGSFFVADKESREIIDRRVAEFDLHPTAPLWGLGEPESRREALALECSCVADNAEMAEGLERAGVAMARRALRIHVQSGAWAHTNDGARLSFTLPRGAYATAVLRELIDAPGL